MNWAKLLAVLTGTVDQELLKRNEYLLAENRILRKHIQGRLRLTDPDRRTLAQFAVRLGKNVYGDKTHPNLAGSCIQMEAVTAQRHLKRNLGLETWRMKCIGGARA